MSRQQHILIVGAGIIGLAAALELCRADCRVTVIERGRAMEESSWAAAGMLAADDPENPAALLPLARLSRALYPEFLAQVEQLSGLRVPLRTSVTLQGHRTQRPGGPAPDALPDLKTDRYSFSALEEASLDPRDLCSALPRAARAAGAELREHQAVIAVNRTEGGIAAKLANGEALPADHLLLAGGAWSGQIALPGLAALPVAPRKGQMIEVTLPSPELPYVVRTPELYLVPRGGGRIVIGATVENAGFDRSIDQAAGERLRQAAAELWPPILNSRITARWTGLRPGFTPNAADSLPILGALAPGLWVATAHFRNGILLAPGTARLLAECIRGAALSLPFQAFSPERFTTLAV